MFITAFEGVLNLKTGELRYVNAGHEMPFICRKNGVYEPFKVKAGFVLAGMEGIRYRSGIVQLQPGDKIFQYSDGVPEAMNRKNEQYGMHRLEKVLAQNSEKTPAELLPAIKADLDAFVGEAEQFDDITMLCIKYNPKGKSADISVTPDQDSIKTVTEFMESTLEEWKVPMKVANKVQIAVDEIYSNIVYYSQAKNAKITVTGSDEKLSLLFEDDGIPYNALSGGTRYRWPRYLHGEEDGGGHSLRKHGREKQADRCVWCEMRAASHDKYDRKGVSVCPECSRRADTKGRETLYHASFFGGDGACQKRSER